MTAPMALPPLPEPARTRWQPLRMGVVELYHYDCEEFWFRDGHLLLRGNNGTGKSKVLSLTLPFLLDANMSAARVEPDGDRGKRMEWNLLMGRHERRIGYVWIEFGRRDEAGEPEILTLGCGLSAVAGRTRVETWHFLTGQRMGRDLWLLTPERVVLSRERLAERLAGRGQVFDTAQEYRRAVDERLFRLGDERYRALMDTLIQLRQPQLSRQPDEAKLSDALTEALPPLPQATLNDVAEAMNQLDAYHQELEELEALRSTVVQFGRRYRVYARVQARRQARVLRQAQTELDNASRTLNEARSELEQAQADLAACELRHLDCERRLIRDRAALDELRRDPVMRDAQRLRDAGRETEERAADLAQAAARLHDAEQRVRDETSVSSARLQQAAHAAARLAEAERAAGEWASHGGVATDHARLYAAGIDSFESGWRRILQRRLEQVDQIRQRLRALADAAATRDRAAEARKVHGAAFDSAQARALAAEAEHRLAADALVGQWQEFLWRGTVLALPDSDAALDDLSAWVESLAGDNPVELMVARAQGEALQRFAQQEAALKHEQAILDDEVRLLALEQARLEQGEDRRPPAPHTRAPEARLGRTGAPLWQLTEFAETVDDEARAGIEAGLEAAGLLDAWVTPEGTLADPLSQDVVLVPRPARAPSLRAWLVPSANAAVPAGTVENILAAIACAPEEPAEAEAWVSPHGQFRLGPARGAWTKPSAQYIGFAARAAARRRRLDEIAAEREVLDQRLAAIRAERDALVAQRDRVNQECEQAPRDGPLREAQARFSAAESQRRETQERLAEAEALWHAAEQVWARVREELQRDASDLRLPDSDERLLEFERTLNGYADAAGRLASAAQERRRTQHELAEQQRRAQEAQAEGARCREDHARRSRAAEEASSRHDLLRQTVGAAVAELQERLALTERAVSAGEEALRKEQARLREAGERRAKSEQKVDDEQQVITERQERRQEAVARLQAFAATGLLEIALPEAGIPDTAATWTIDPALQLARRVEQALADLPAEEADWTRIQGDISRDFTQLMQAMSARNHQALAEQSDYGLVVRIVYQNRRERPDVLEQRLAAESTQRREILTAREREVLENHLQAEVATGLQKLLQEAERRLQSINAELTRRPTSTGVRFKLEWQPLPEGEEGAPVGLAAARARLLNRSPEAWSSEDRRLVGEFLQRRIQSERLREEGGTLLDHLSRALDYRRWHRFRVRRFQDGAWRSLSGPASSGERALGLTVPLFAAASSHYASADYRQAPRLVLLDEAFAGIDDEARAHCMALIREFDLDFVMTSEREWGCYAELPGLAISHLVRREGVDAVYVSRWTWDGCSRKEEPDPSRRFPEAVASAA